MTMRIFFNRKNGEIPSHRGMSGSLAMLPLLATLNGFSGTEPEKMVFAHYMPNQANMYAPYDRQINPYDTKAIGKEFGGIKRSAPLFAACWYKPGQHFLQDQKEFIRQEIEMAQSAGIDGFLFDYGGGGKADSDELHVHLKTGFIGTFFEVAESSYPDFKLALCADQAATGSALNRRIITINQFLERHGDSPNLYRINGRAVLFTYRANALEPYDFKGNQGAPAEQIFSNMREVVQNWKTVLNRLNQPMHLIADLPSAWLYDRLWGWSEDQCRDFFDMWAKEFEGLSVFGPLDTPEQQNTIYPMMNAACENYGKIFMPCATFGWRRPNKGFRVIMHDAELFLESWELILKLNPPMIQIATWNDYCEETGITATINHNYALIELTGFFSKWYKEGQMPEIEEDKIFLFYKRYVGRPEPTDFPDTAKLWYPLSEDLHVITLSPTGGTLHVEGYPEVSVKPGFQSHLFPLQTGPVRAELYRGGKKVAEVEGLTPVIDNPYRSHLGTYCISSECRSRFKSDTGFELDPADERWADINENGIADWVELINASSESRVIPPQPVGTEK